MKKLWIAILMIMSFGTVCLAADKVEAPDALCTLRHGPHEVRPQPHDRHLLRRQQCRYLQPELCRDRQVEEQGQERQDIPSGRLQQQKTDRRQERGLGHRRFQAGAS